MYMGGQEMFSRESFIGYHVFCFRKLQKENVFKL